MHTTIKRMSTWMFDQALPWWLERSWDVQFGGCVEAFAFDGTDAACPFKRTRVACRQIYVYSHAHLLGWSQGLDLAERLIDHLVDNVWLGEESGFARRMKRTGEVLDPTTDLYDHSFALFAFAWHFKATQSERSRAWAEKTLEFIERRLRHPSQPGFIHEIPTTGWRLQNPHMHLAEATLAAYDAIGDERYARVANEVITLFRTKFLDVKKGTLAEFFTDTLDPAPGEDGQRTEPGHQFEWAWILNSAQKSLGLDLAEEIRGLIAFGERTGVDPVSFATYNAVRTDGKILDGSSRSWPNTERLKAAVALFELDGTDPMPVIEQTGGLLLDRYLAIEPAGTWIDNFDAHGKPTAADIPTSILYHVFLAFAEVLRIAPRLDVK